MMAMAVLGCPDTASECSAPTAAPAAGSLAFELPPGVSVSIDGEDRGTTPLDPLQLTPAAHAVLLKTPCATTEQTVVVQPGQRTSIDRAGAAGLKFATIHVRAKTIRDKALSVKLHASETEIPGEDGTFEVPACPARFRVEPIGTLAYNLGSFIEDLDPKPGERIERDLVLRPGPDVVRLHGGPFRQGPHESDTDDPRTPLPPKRVTVPSFDIDKTEVTARQFMDCLGEGRCEKQPGRVVYRDHCVFDFSNLYGQDATVFGRRMIEGKEDLPANCVNIIEARSYCQWRGMRLPTPLEFDYAFRSGRSDYAFPWGTDESQCRSNGVDEPACVEELEFHRGGRPPTYEGRRWRDNPQPACSFAGGSGTSEQGVCDLAGNLLEFAVFASDFDDETRHYALGGETAMTVARATLARSALPGASDLGFRCVAVASDEAG